MRRFLCFTAMAGVACSGTDPSDELCQGLVAGDLVITELMTDPNGEDIGSQWIEIYDARSTPIDLKGVTLYAKKLDGTAAKNAIIRAGTVASGAYFALGDVRTGALPEYIGYSYEDALGSLSHGEGIIGIRCSEAVIDELQYTVAPKPGYARQLDGRLRPDPSVNDDEGNFCDADQPLEGTSSFGTPGLANTPCVPHAGPGNCIDASTGTLRAVVSPLPAEVFFTEVMADPNVVSDLSGEWLELRAVNDVDLNDVVLGVSGSNHTLASPTCLHVTAGSYAVLAKSVDAGVNGGLYDVLTTFDQSLGNAGGTLTLSREDAGIDRAEYPAATSGVAWQLDPTKLDATNNDDPASFCLATVDFTGIDGGDLGTPGASNTRCGVVIGPTQCFDTGTARVRELLSPSAGELIITEVMADPRAVSDTVGEWIEVRAASAVDLNGLVLAVDGRTHSLAASHCLHLATGEYAILAKTSDSAANGGLPAVLATFTQSLANSGGTIALTTSDGTVDQAVYGAAISGVAWQLDPFKLNATSNDAPANFCRATVSIMGSGGDLGTPGAANTPCPPMPTSGQCIDPLTSTVRSVVKPVPGSLVITELMAHPSAVADAVGEYIEVRSNSAFDLNGIVLGFDSSTSVLNSQTCLTVRAGEYSVFAPNADSSVNGGLPPLAGTFSFSLLNSGTHRLSVSNDAGVLDVLVYSDDAGHPVAGASTQLSAQFTLPADNDIGTHLCTTSNASHYGPAADAGIGDRGTPGLPNEICP